MSLTRTQEPDTVAVDVQSSPVVELVISAPLA